MLSMHLFNTLDVNTQIKYVWDNAIFISSRTKGNFTINLHQLHNFYVKLLYCDQANKVKQVMAFKTTKHLENYLNTPELNIYITAVKKMIKSKNIS